MPERITLDEAARELGLRLPVRIELHASLGPQTGGRYLGITGGSHRIALVVGKKTKLPKVGTRICLPAKTATIWHELTHALQCERDHDGNSRRFYRHYTGVLADLLGVEPDDYLVRHVGERVNTEKRRHGWSATLGLYAQHPMEAEANAVSVVHANVEVTFVNQPEDT